MTSNLPQRLFLTAERAAVLAGPHSYEAPTLDGRTVPMTLVYFLAGGCGAQHPPARFEVPIYDGAPSVERLNIVVQWQQLHWTGVW